ncbi:M15 family metallopeptidase [Aquihabitans sp. G128]|uniref:M15 family metallopeptidase n=1 Tax=Aquihabitans sp. G128 TaxID=2849779 RepID=UPI001C24D076|nr:M15 family metallopeptidase [Aquihabitans sp. G128]QXC62170.1 M15 family metallopeptidase [Aquihabitans sp. G128]
MRRGPLRQPLVVAAALSVLLAACLDPTTGTPPPKGATVPAYTSSIATVTAEDLGSSWRAGCPVGPSGLRRVWVAYWGYDGERHTGDLVVARAEAADVAKVFGRLYAERFPIRRIHPVTAYGSSDDDSMAANNTSAFNCRKVTGGSGWSEHAYGTAIDLNPVQNPYVTPGGTVLPPSGRPWKDRSVRAPGMVHAGDATTKAFAAIGWGWGGSWSSTKDHQHFSASGH